MSYPNPHQDQGLRPDTSTKDPLRALRTGGMDGGQDVAEALEEMVRLREALRSMALYLLECCDGADDFGTGVLTTSFLRQAIERGLSARMDSGHPLAFKREKHASGYVDPLTTGQQPSPPDDDAVSCLRELHALVWGECPSLLNEDSGGCGRLDVAIRAVLETHSEGGQPKCP